MMLKLQKHEWVIKIITVIISLAAFCCIWGLAVAFTGIGRAIPGPIEVFRSFFEHFVVPYGEGTLPLHIFSSLKRVLVGYIAAATGGVVLGYLMGTYRTVDAIVSPLFNIIRPIPPVAWIPLAILWFGIYDGSKYFLIFLATFLSVVQNAYAGAKAADPTLVGAARMLGADDRHIFTTIILPGSVPYIAAGLQLGLTSAWAQVVASEMIRSTEGVGWIIIRGMDNNNALQELVGILVIGIIGFILSSAMRGVENYLCKWNKRGK